MRTSSSLGCDAGALRRVRLRWCPGWPGGHLADARGDRLRFAARQCAARRAMASIPEAVYWMGTTPGEPDEGPRHQARAAAFEMDLTEVTVVQYAQCVRAHACAPAPDTVRFPGAIAADHAALTTASATPTDRSANTILVNCVDWTMAETFCRWAGKRLPTGEADPQPGTSIKMHCLGSSFELFGTHSTRWPMA